MGAGKLEDLLQLTKVSDFLKKKSTDEKVMKIVKIVLICVGALAVLAAAGFVVYKLVNRYNEDYDLYDDLDNYYDDEEDAVEEAADDVADAVADAFDEAKESDFAE